MLSAIGWSWYSAESFEFKGGEREGQTAGIASVFFDTPFGIFSSILQPVMHEAEFSTRIADVPHVFVKWIYSRLNFGSLKIIVEILCITVPVSDFGQVGSHHIPSRSEKSRRLVAL